MFNKKRIFRLNCYIKCTVIFLMNCVLFLDYIKRMFQFYILYNIFSILQKFVFRKYKGIQNICEILSFTFPNVSSLYVVFHTYFFFSNANVKF